MSSNFWNEALGKTKEGVLVALPGLVGAILGYLAVIIRRETKKVEEEKKGVQVIIPPKQRRRRERRR